MPYYLRIRHSVLDAIHSDPRIVESNKEDFVQKTWINKLILLAVVISVLSGCDGAQVRGKRYPRNRWE